MKHKILKNEKLKPETNGKSRTFLNRRISRSEVGTWYNNTVFEVKQALHMDPPDLFLITKCDARCIIIDKSQQNSNFAIRHSKKIKFNN